MSDGIAPAPSGIPQIEVTFDIDANGIVNVSAKDKGTGKEQHITISNSTSMSKEDVERAVQEAEKFATEDKKRRETVEAKNEAENLVYAAEKLISDNGDKIEEGDKTELNQKIATLKEALPGDNMDAINLAKEDLQKTVYAISEKLYKAAAPQEGAATDDPKQDANGNNVYDAEYKDVNEDDNK